MLSVIALLAFAPDTFLLPENFYLHKGDKLDLHVISGTNFAKEGENKYSVANTIKFNIYEGSKKTDLTATAKDNALPVVSYPLNNAGLALVEMNSKPESNDIPRDQFVTYLTEQGFETLADKIKNSNSLYYTEKSTRYLKTLFTVDNAGGNVYEKVLGTDFEIILKQNPYKKSYGEDITALINYKGKPLKNSPAYLYIKTVSGNVYPQKLDTDAAGQIYFTLSREGIYMIRCVNIQESTNKDADYETITTNFTFAFSNQSDLPNTYKEFGFGDKH
ncbi:DUF4198 domain-containing protein [Mucilaginibacter glaciei]|uniref:DUF4198 domain-containing protein n=1 Tax=Mucilaginibacter glaciei TaxID=2772109 RepID=A0A926NXK9_9SPHI|nr:DUF4198 domain-containing protein [Mucilaginibacter glaciei]MBD1393673.1 DUF4198 domain-containing protein [Mucilaginibacter glaciei]